MTLYRWDELEKIAFHGAVVIIKIDGDRKDEGKIFTVVLSGGKLDKNTFFRMDGEDLEVLIDNALRFYEENQ